MKHLIYALTIAFSFHALAQNKTAVLTSEFRGKTADGHYVKLTQGEQGWIFADATPCVTFPCADSDSIKKVLLKADFVEDHEPADGNSEILLGSNMILIHVNLGFRAPRPGESKESYWKLVIKKEDGSSEEVRLRHSPEVVYVDSLKLK